MSSLGKTVCIEVDGNIISCQKGANLLQTCLDAGIYVPSLCSHPAIKSIGSCRMCLVEIEGEKEPVTSCTIKVQEGMKVRTNSETIRKLRRLAMELILSEHPEDCSSCPKFGNCILQSVIQYVGASNGRLKSIEKLSSPNTKNPLFIHDMYRCIKCGRCVRVCRDVRGIGAIKYIRDAEGDVVVGCGADLLADAGCRFCGACVEVCPTGALRDKDGFIDRTKPRELAYVPCRSSCPAHINVPQYVRQIKAGDYTGAIETVRQKSPFPGSLGYICNRFCEKNCRRGEIDDAIAIRELKRVAAKYADDSWKQRFIRNTPTGKRVAVIGAGPAGLAAALRLVRYGNTVEVFEELPNAGGMLRYGIPEYRLPKSVVAGEISDIVELGVIIHTGSGITDPIQLLKDGFDSVAICIGAHKGNEPGIEGEELSGVWKGVEFMRSVNMGTNERIGERVVVIGGGNVAIDCARTALREGAKEVTMLCRGPKSSLKADSDEIEEALEEGVTIAELTTICRINGSVSVESVTAADVSEYKRDETGKLHWSIDENSSRVIPADAVIFAMGQKPAGAEAMGFTVQRGGFIWTDGRHSTNIEGVFAAGDVSTGTKSVIEAVADGNATADSIAAFLGNSPLEAEMVLIRPEKLGKSLEFGSTRISKCETECQIHASAERCLQCDLRTDIEPQKFWTEFLKGGV